MANNLGSLVVSLGLDAAQFTSGMSKAEYEAFRSTEKMKANFAAVGKFVAGLGIGAIFVQSIRNAADYADSIGKLAAKAGETSTEFSKLAYAARQADVDNATLSKGLRALGEDALSGGKKLADLGISATDSSGAIKTNAQLMRELAEAITRIEDPQRRAAAAAELLGAKVGPELIPLLEGGASGLKDMADEAERFGRIVNDDAAKAAAELNDNLTKLNEIGGGVATTIGNAIIPWINNMAAQFKLARDNSDSFYESLFRTGTSNAPQRIQDTTEKIKELNASLKDKNLVGLPRARVEDAIASAQKDLNLLNAFQRQKQLADNDRLASQFGSDKSKINSLSTRATPYFAPYKSPEPSKTPRRITSVGGKDPILEANDKEAGMLALLGRIEDDEKRKRQESSPGRQFAIDELESIQKANTGYQALMDRLMDDTPTAKLEAQRVVMSSLADEYERGRFGAVGSAEAVAKFGETANTYLGNAADKVKESNSAAQEFGLTMSSAFEEAMLSGKKFSDVVQGLIRDLAQMALRKAVIEPMAAGIAGFASSLFTSYDGGGYTGSGSRSGGMDGKGGFMAMLHPNETVVDHTKGQGSGGGVSISYTIDARGADASVDAKIRAAMRETEAKTLAAVQANSNRGGSFARSMGRA